VRKIIVSFHATEPDTVGSEREVPQEEGALLVREGRARWADTHPDDANDPYAVPPEEAAAATAQAEVAEQNQQAAAAAALVKTPPLAEPANLPEHGEPVPGPPPLAEPAAAPRAAEEQTDAASGPEAAPKDSGSSRRGGRAGE
jgi:hypothetical protein